MTHGVLRARLLVAIGATSLAALAVACGSESTPTADAGGASGDAAADGAKGDGATNDGATGDGSVDDGSTTFDASSSDAPFDSPSVRRPFLVRSVPRATPVALRDDWMAARAMTAAAVDEATSRALAAAYLKDATEEHASIAAFARFSMLLLAVGAPADLVAACQRAGSDEIEHAKIAFALARRYGGEVAGPGPLEIHDALTARTLLDVVVLTAHEGCVGETLGAAIAREQAAVATDPDVKRALEKIHKDEIRHAELAWRFVRWAIDVGGEPVRAAACLAIDEGLAAALAFEEKPLPAGVDLATWHAHGRLTCKETREAAERAIAEVVRPCASALARVGLEARAHFMSSVHSCEPARVPRAPSPELRPSTPG